MFERFLIDSCFIFFVFWKQHPVLSQCNGQKGCKKGSISENISTYFKSPCRKLNFFKTLFFEFLEDFFWLFFKRFYWSLQFFVLGFICIRYWFFGSILVTYLVSFIDDFIDDFIEDYTYVKYTYMQIALRVDAYTRV